MASMLTCEICLEKKTDRKPKSLSCLHSFCHRFHSNQTIFKSHQIDTDLCEVHGNAVSHVCVTCFTGVCIDCVLSEVHESHDMCERDEGIGKLRQSVEDSQRQLKDLRNKIKQRMKTTERKTEIEIELTIAKLKHAADAMKQEIDRQLTEVIKQYRKQTLQEMKKSFDEFENLNLPKTLGGLEQENVIEQNMTKIVELNTELNKVIREVKTAEERIPGISEKPKITDVLKEVGKPLSLLQYHDKYNRSDVESKLRESLSRDISGKPKMVWQKVSIDCKEIDVPFGLEIMDDFTAVAAFRDRDYVVRFDENGKVVASYYCNGLGDANKVGNVTTDDGNIYIQCMDRHTVIRIPVGGFNGTTRHIKNILNQYYFTLNPYNNTFLLSSDEGKVFCCRETDMSLEECSLSPGRIRVLPYTGSYRNVVASYSTKTVMVYDEDETLLYTLTGCGDNDHFQGPCDVSMLGHDTLLVADRFNDRVCKFRMSDGSFEGLLLTKEDSVLPLFIACKYPYLWFTGWSVFPWGWALQLYKWS